MSEPWTDWFDRHGAGLLLYARQFGHCRADAEDIVQTAFVRFWKKRAQVENPLAYLYTCVASVARDWRRGEQRRREREQESWFSRTPRDPSPTGVAECVQGALPQLPAEQCQVVVLKIWGELTFEDIGAALLIPPSTAASRYRYALAALRKLLPGSQPWPTTRTTR